jgi:hypothetical protein
MNVGKPLASTLSQAHIGKYENDVEAMLHSVMLALIISSGYGIVDIIMAIV